MEKLSSFEEVRKNNLNSNFLMFFFVIFISLLGSIIGIVYGNVYFGLILAILISFIYILIMRVSGDKIVLKMSGARPVTKKEYPYLFHTIEGLALAAGLPTPKAYVIDDSAMNAFATGMKPENSSITVTTGLLEALDRQELEGVVAHEMSHIKNYDIKYMLLVAVMVGITTLLSDFLLRSFLWGGKGRRNNNDNGSQMKALLIVLGLVLAILTPLITQLIKLAISRKREYAADANAVILTRYPEGLASALEKIKGDPDPLVDKANKATAHLFISNPFKKGKRNLFSTHPPIDERIKKLRAM